MQIAEKVCNHSELPGYTVEKIGYSWFEGTKEITILITTRNDITNEERGKILEQETLKYLKNNKEENIIVALYNSVASLNKDNYVNKMKYISSIDSLESMKIYKEVEQNINTSKNTSNDSNPNSNNNSNTENNNSNKK